MKTILATTDYSKPSLNAARYAINLAIQMQAKVLLYHACRIPIITSDVTAVAIPYDDMEKENNILLDKMAVNLRKEFKNKVEINYLTQVGFAPDVLIENLSEKKKIDLIVMGIKGAGKMKEIIIGSTASEVVGKVKCPVFIIPEKATFTKFKRIVFASDNEKIANTSNLKILKELTEIFKSQLYVLHVTDANKSTKEEQKKALEIEKYFNGINHKVQFIENKYDDIIADINEFVKKNDIDLVTMVARKHSLFNRIFNERKTKQMAFHTHAPLLSLHD